MNNSGIYQIRNIKNNKRYIGSAVDLNMREYHHFYYLNKNTHHNIYLQRAWNKHGKKKFIFESLILCSQKELIYWEQLFLDNLAPEYNILSIANSQLGTKRSLETRKKISNARKGKNHSVETKKKIGDASKGNTCAEGCKHTPEMNYQKSLRMRGKQTALGYKHTEETKKKISLALLGNKHASKKEIS